VDILGYLWENLTPAMTIQSSKRWIGLRYFVLHNSKEKEKIGTWITERRNIIEDYKKIFGKKYLTLPFGISKDTPRFLFGIAIMIDSDDTDSSSECYFDDIVFQSP
jgi:hypothetical protein